MPSYSQELKDQIAKKMMPPNNCSVADISRETGIGAATLYAWKKRLQAQGHVVPNKQTTADQWDARAKLAVVIQTAPMNAAERAAYCRERGLYPEQIDAWRDAIETADWSNTADNRTQLTAERKKSRALEKELRRKEKALAEAAALLTLSKKARAIWGEDAED